MVDQSCNNEVQQMSKSSILYQQGSFMFPYHEESTRCGECQSTVQIRFRCPYVRKDQNQHLLQ